MELCYNVRESNGAVRERTPGKARERNDALRDKVTYMSKQLKKSLVLQGSILAAAGLISKIIGFIYRVPMANIMGNTGNGLYSVSFGIYNIALTLSSYSMPLAVSRLMSARLARKEYRNAHRLFIAALVFASVTGLTAALVLFFGADLLAVLYQKEGLQRPLRILAPTTFTVAILGTCRGYYQGHRNMVPTAVSQVIEQIINAIVSVVAAGQFAALCTQEGQKASYGAMGGTLGTFAGALSALFLFLILFVIDRNGRREEIKRDAGLTPEENKLLYKAILFTVLPVILSQSIYQLGYTLDDLIFSHIMTLKGWDEVRTTDIQGIFHTQYNQLVNLPTAVATSMAAASMPSIVGSYTRKENAAVRHKIDVVLKTNMIIAFPSAVGLAVLADPIMGVLFPGLKEYHSVASGLLLTGSAAVLFYALSTLSTSILQSCDRMRVPVVHAGISLGVHVLLLALLLYGTDLGEYALIIGNVTFPMLVCILNCRYISRMLNYQFDWKNSFIKPAAAAVIMGGITALIYSVIYRIGKNMLLSMLAAIAAAVAVYLLLLYLLRAFTKEELKTMPVVKRWIK